MLGACVVRSTNIDRLVGDSHTYLLLPHIRCGFLTNQMAVQDF